MATITSRDIDIAFKRGYDARVAEEQSVTVVSRHPGIAEALLSEACDDNTAAMREDVAELTRLRSLITPLIEKAIRDYENFIHNGRRFDLVAAHVAERVEAKLRLTEETEWRLCDLDSRTTAPWRRWVSRWSPVLEQP